VHEREDFVKQLQRPRSGTADMPPLIHGRCNRDGLVLVDHARCRLCGGLAGTAHPERPLDDWMHCGMCCLEERMNGNGTS